MLIGESAHGIWEEGSAHLRVAGKTGVDILNFYHAPFSASRTLANARPRLGLSVAVRGLNSAQSRANLTSRPYHAELSGARHDGGQDAVGEPRHGRSNGGIPKTPRVDKKRMEHNRSLYF